MDVRGSLNAEENQVYITGEGAQSTIENDSFFARVPPQAASTVGRSKSRRYLEEESEMGSFLDSLPRNGLPRSVRGEPGFLMDGMLGSRTLTSQSRTGYAIPNGGLGGGQLVDFGTGKPGDEWSVVNAWCRENINTRDSDTDGKSSLGILNVDDMDVSNNLLLETPMEELLRGRGGQATLDKPTMASKHSFPAENTNSRLFEGSSDNQTPKLDSNPRLLEGSSGSQDSKGLLTVDSNTWSREASASTSQDSKDHPFAQSRVGTVKKAGGGPQKADPLTSAIKQSLFGQLPIGEVAEEADASVHNVELGDEDLNELDHDFGEMEYSIGEDSDKEEEGSKTPTNKEQTTAGDDGKLASKYLRHGLTESFDGEEEKSKKLTYLSKVALFDENGNDFNSGSELDTEDELEIARKGMRHAAAGEDSAAEDLTRPGLEGGCSDNGQLPITQRQSAEGIVVSPVPGDGGGGGDGSSGSESDDGRGSGNGTNYPSRIHGNYMGSGDNRFLPNTANQEQRIRPMGDDLLTEMLQSRYSASSTTLENEDSRLQSRYLRAISPANDLTPDNFNIEDYLLSTDESQQQQDFDPGNRLEASGFNANDAREANSNPFGAMESSFGSFGLSGPQPGDDSLPAGFGQPSNAENQLRLSGNQNVSNEAWERMIGSNRTSASSRSGSSGGQGKSPKLGLSPAGSLEKLPIMPERGSRGNSLGERTAASGSLGRSSGGGLLPTRRSESPVSGYSSGGSDPGLRSSFGKKEEAESSLFKVPAVPIPKMGLKTKGARPKTTANQKRELPEQGNRQSSMRSSAHMDSMTDDDLAFRMSLTGIAEKQKEGLKRVPSLGGTSELDMTIPDIEFFGNDEGLQMLESDEKQFEEENVFRQDDAMVNPSSPNDSWAYQSIQSVARPSWMDPGDAEETLHVRISVGTFIRGRTEALGTLEGDGSGPRPDFGMNVESPQRISSRPVGLIDIEEARTSGVGENSNGETERNPGAGVSDETLSIDALSAENTVQGSVLDLEALGISNIDKTLKFDSSHITPEDVSIFLKTGRDPTKIVEGLNQLRDSKHCSIARKSEHLPATKSVGFKPNNTALNQQKSPSKSSHLPVKRGSNIRSFPRVSDSNQTFDRKRESNVPGIDSVYSSASVSDDTKLGESVKKAIESNIHNTISNKSNTQNSKDNPESDETSTQAMVKPVENTLTSEVWSSPPRASLCPNTSGVLEKLQEFSFKFSTSKMDTEKHKLASDLREKFKEQPNCNSFGARTDLRDRHTADMYVGERETPPPDGQANNGSKVAQTAQASMISTKDGFSSVSDLSERKMSDMSAKPKRYDSGFDSVSTRDSSLSRQRDQLNSELKSTLRSRSLISAGSEILSFDIRDVDSRNSVSFQGHSKSSLSATSSHVGMVPDGNEYSRLSDYPLRDHKGMSQDDLEGTTNIGLADSRSFDAVRGTKSQISSQELERVLRSQIQRERDKEMRTGRVPVSEGSTGDRTFQNDPQNVKSKPPVDLQPSLSLSPAPKRRLNTTQVAGFGDQGTDFKDVHKTVETQTAADRHESWTQTSVVLRESIGLQPDETLVSRLENDSRNQSSSAHNQNENKDSKAVGRESEKPQLLSKDSLLKTEFAQEYLKRDFSMEVMDRIYSSSEKSQLTQHYIDSTVSQLHGRESIESINNWTMLKPNETMETTYDDFSRTKMADLTHPSFYHKPPSACSTPFHGKMQTALTPSSVHPQSSTGYQSMLASERNTNKGKDLGPLCPVQAPGILKFPEACVVGISKTEVLPLTNPTDRWLECILKVKSVEIDGRKAGIESFPFEMRQKKIILDPHKTEKVEVLFLPNRPGAFVAEVLVFSQLFLRNEKDTVDGIPVSVTFQAIAEKPKIVVSCEDDGSGVIPFGELSWGMCKEKTICLKNQGLATVPLRLVIVSEGKWHCFSFEPEGRTSDVSIISGRQLPSQTRSVINLCLPGANTPFNYQEIKVWCRPPDKHCDRAMARLPAEHFSCKVDIELDIPYSKVSVCRPLRLEAVVGVHKLHIQSNIKELQLTACPGKSRETGFKIYNAGNLELNLSFWFMSNSEVFTVTPDTLMGLQPAEEAMLTINFMPKDTTEQRCVSVLIMMVQPQGPMFEIQVQGNVLARRRDLDVMCDCTEMNFGGVVLGQTSVKRFRLINRESEDVTMTLIARVDDIELYRSSDTSIRGSSILDCLLKPEQIVPVYVLFAPSTSKPVRGKIVMKSEQSDRKYTVHVSGYGGVSKLCCSERSTEFVSIKGLPCIRVQNLATERVKHFYINNRGSRTATVKVAAFTELSCSRALPAGQVIVQPNDFVVDSQGTQKVEVVISMSPRQFSECCQDGDVGAALRFSYQDKIDWPKPHKSQLIVGLVETGKKLETRPSGQSLSVTSGAQNMTVQSGTMTKLSQTAPHVGGHEKSVAFSIKDDPGSALAVMPEELVLYCPTGDCEPEVDMFHICNTRDREVSFQLSWPADMITLKPGRGTVKPRDRQKIIISASKEVKQCLDQLPWKGSVTVHCGRDMKTLKVEVRRETVLPPERAPTDDQSLVPVGTSHCSQALPGVSKLGNLEISRTTIEFPSTKVGKTSDEMVELKNTGKDTIRWMFSSFAAPYLKKRADNPKELFRVSYKVFDFSHQFGKLNGHSTVQLKLQFMPRSMGTFSQYWDIQTSGNTTSTAEKEESIRIHLTGEGKEEETIAGPSAVLDDLVPGSRPEHQKLKLLPEILKYPSVHAGTSTVLKVDLKNGYVENVKIEVTEPKPPFYIRHHSIKIDKKRYLRFPVEFQPSRPGSFTDTVKFQSSKGETLVLRVEGQCS